MKHGFLEKNEFVECYTNFNKISVKSVKLGRTLEYVIVLVGVEARNIQPNAR